MDGGDGPFTRTDYHLLVGNIDENSRFSYQILVSNSVAGSQSSLMFKVDSPISYSGHPPLIWNGMNNSNSFIQIEGSDEKIALEPVLNQSWQVVKSELLNRSFSRTTESQLIDGIATGVMRESTVIFWGDGTMVFL